MQSEGSETPVPPQGFAPRHQAGLSPLPLQNPPLLAFSLLPHSSKPRSASGATCRKAFMWPRAQNTCQEDSSRIKCHWQGLQASAPPPSELLPFPELRADSVSLSTAGQPPGHALLPLALSDEKTPCCPLKQCQNAEIGAPFLPKSCH